MKKVQTGDICYACGGPSVNVEHAPPRSWFASKNWSDPFTVPSCVQHNNDNSKDVEYVRDILASMSVNDCANSVWQQGTRPAAEAGRGPVKLLSAKTKVVNNGDQQVDATDVDTHRIKHVFRAIGDALRFCIYKTPRQHNWFVYAPWLNSHEEATASKTLIDSEAVAAHWFSQESKAPHCFEWWTSNFNDQLVLRLQFYDTVDVFLVERPANQEPIS